MYVMGMFPQDTGKRLCPSFLKIIIVIVLLGWASVTSVEKATTCSLPL